MLRRAAASAIGLTVLLAAWSCGTRPGRGLIVLCAGDSITEQAYPRLLQQALKKEGRRARVLNYGRSGHTTGEYLKFLTSRLDRIETEKPDVVLLQLGTNDVRLDGDRTPLAEFERNLRAIIRIFEGVRNRRGRPTAVLLATIPPIPDGVPFPFGPESARRVVDEINPAVRTIAAELKLVLVDNYALFAAAPGLLPGVHPSPEGYRRLAARWLQALRPFLD